MCNITYVLLTINCCSYLQLRFPQWSLVCVIITVSTTVLTTIHHFIGHLFFLLNLIDIVIKCWILRLISWTCNTLMKAIDSKETIQNLISSLFFPSLKIQQLCIRISNTQFNHLLDFSCFHYEINYPWMETHLQKKKDLSFVLFCILCERNITMQQVGT